MSEDTLKLAQTVARALIDLHERMGKIAEEAELASKDVCVGRWPLQKLARILALTKGKSE